MTKRDFWKYLTRVHRYVGMVLGVQILIWFTSGFVMSFFDIDRVRGEHIAEKVSFELSLADIMPIDRVPAQDATSVKLMSAAGHPVYKVQKDEALYYAANTGEPWEGLPREAALFAAGKYYKGEAAPHVAVKLDAAPIEYRGALPVWQLSYDDPQKTRLYLDADTGELKAVRTRLWRVFDFMWMLHIMDYDERDDINNWWLWLCSGFASLFALSGIMLVVHRVWLRPRRKKPSLL